MSSNDTAKLFGPLRYWKTRQAASTCILVTISAICVCILVVCGVLLAREYSLAKGYERTLCGVSNVTSVGPERSCHFCYMLMREVISNNEFCGSGFVCRCS